MKRIFALLLFSLFINSCDDGDLTVETLNFDSVAVQRCSNGNVLYKLGTNEALIMEIPSATALVNDPTPAGTPLSFTIDGSHRVIYRSYNGAVTNESICGTIPPASPAVTEEWTASSGTIEIVTTAILTDNPALPGGQQLTGYKHTITLRNVTFVKPDGEQLYETFNFGDYNSAVTPLPFNFDGSLEKCSTSNLIYDYVGTQALTLSIDADLLQSEVTAPGEPRIGLLGTSDNLLTYISFASGPLSSDYFCTTPLPSTPVIAETWTGVEGVEGVSGIVEVTTTTSGSAFLHEIHLKNVTLKKGNSTFLIANDYLFGQLLTE